MERVERDILYPPAFIQENFPLIIASGTKWTEDKVIFNTFHNVPSATMPQPSPSELEGQVELCMQLQPFQPFTGLNKVAANFFLCIFINILLLLRSQYYMFINIVCLRTS